ncbi:MAG TPA: GNAT family N-acetyltransferase [Anaeromyxobacter sp.]|nr:GNAT family N-acetyltransferase [Anaeromyxobacter sp.]
MPAPRIGPFLVRDARQGDLTGLARMGARLAREHHALDPHRFFLPEEPIEVGYAWWLGKELANPRAAILVASRRGRLLGYAYGRVERRDWNTLRDRCAVGVDLWVEPRARRGGIGRALVEALVERFARQRQPRMIIQVAARNRLARRAFAGMRFRETLVEMARELAEGEEP